MSGASTSGALSDEDRVAAQIEQMAEDVVAAELENMKSKNPSDMPGMVGKENLHRNGKPVYTPVRQFLEAEFKTDRSFVAEVRGQQTLLEEKYGHDLDAMREQSGDQASATGAVKKVNVKLFDPYTKPIFRIVCGEHFDYRDCGLSPRAKMLLESIDRKLHAKLLLNDKLSLRDIEKIRANLFKGILFTRGISPFLLAQGGEDKASSGKGVSEVNKNWSSAANRSFNLDYKDFAKSFVQHGNENLPEEAKKLYKARQDKVKAKRTQELTKPKRSKNVKARSQPALLQGEDFQRALRAEGRRHKAEVSVRKEVEPAESLEGTVAHYRKLYSENWTGSEKKRFQGFFDQRANAWLKKNAENGDTEALEKELKAIFKDFKAELKKAEVQAQSSSSPSNTTASSSETVSSTSDAPLSPRRKAREEYGIAETAKRRKQREEAFDKSLKEFLESPHCAVDFVDETFRADFCAAAWEAFDPDRSAKDAPAMLRQTYEERLLAHFKRSVAPAAKSDAATGSHPRLKQLDAAVAAWKKVQGKDGRLLTGEVLSAIWMRIERDAVTLAQFKSALSEKDKAAIGKFASLDAAVERWRALPENASKPLSGQTLEKLWLGGSPNKAQLGEPGSPAQQNSVSGEAARRIAQDKARERMRKQLEGFLKDPKNPDFSKRGFERTFIDNVIEQQRQGGLAALQPEKLKRIYTETQIQRYWTSRKEAGWPDEVRDKLASLIHAKCEQLGNHIAGEEHFEEYRAIAMDNALGPMLQAFLDKRPSWQRMEPMSQFSFRKSMSDALRTWIGNGAPGSVEKQFKSTYEDKLLEKFDEAKRAEGKGRELLLLRSSVADWRRQHGEKILEWDVLESLYNSLPDTGFIDEMTKDRQ